MAQSRIRQYFQSSKRRTADRHETAAKRRKLEDGSSFSVPLSKPDQLNLPLPFHFKDLVEKYSAMDTVLAIMQKRGDTCTFAKVKKAVEELTRRNFDKKDLERMMAVSDSLIVKQALIRGSSQYQLTVEAAGEDGEALPAGNSLSITALMKRTELFKAKMTSIVKQQHKDFLASLDPPVEFQEDKLLHWHVAFPLEKIPLEECQLPSSSQLEKCTARAVLADAHNRFMKTHHHLPIDSSPSTSSSSSAPHQLKGVSSALLERVRQKEVAAKAVATMTPDRDVEYLERLPEMCRILRIFFVAEKKAALTWEAVVDKLSESHSSGLSTNSAEEHLNMLISLLPCWITKVDVRKRTYLKINKETSLKVLITELQTK